MKSKKFGEAIRQAQKAVKAANAAPDNAMQEPGGSGSSVEPSAGTSNPWD